MEKRCFIKYSYDDSKQPLRRIHKNDEIDLDFDKHIEEQVMNNLFRYKDLLEGFVVDFILPLE